ncbi:MAG: hypothetical protein HZB51_11975 [Chloroflexi bacterium]|nr:hypothetical protein [Chloroflexota bacterium]
MSLIIFLSMMPLIQLIFLPRGKKFGQAMEQSLKQAQVTPELRAAFADPVVEAAHLYELAGVVLIVILMVTKPF